PVHVRARDGPRVRLLRPRPDGLAAEVCGPRGLLVADTAERGVLRRLVRPLRTATPTQAHRHHRLRLPRLALAPSAHLCAHPQRVHTVAGLPGAGPAGPGPRLTPLDLPARPSPVERKWWRKPAVPGTG